MFVSGIRETLIYAPYDLTEGQKAILALDDDGHRQVVRNGRSKERELVTGIGPVRVAAPRVNDKRAGEKFTSQILPPFMRRVPSIDALIPCLYLKGVSTGDFVGALEAILGPQATGLSATNIVRLKEVWKADYDAWRKRDLSDKHYVYMWADGIHFNVRLDDERMCMLVIIGATPDGRKERCMMVIAKASSPGPRSCGT